MSKPPKGYTETVTLKDGRQVTLRPIVPKDAPKLQEAFAHLSPESKYMRFFEAASALSDEQARDFATVDYHDRMAFVSETIFDRKPAIIAVARYSVIPGAEPRMAEVAIVVADALQSNGLGKIMMNRLVRYAQEHAIKIFYGTVHTTNDRIRNFINSSGLESERTMLEPGVWEYHIYLDPTLAPEAKASQGDTEISGN